MWKVPISHRHPPSGHQLTLCANDAAGVQDAAVKMSVSAPNFSVKNAELEMPHEAKIRDTFPVNPHAFRLWGRSYFALFLVITSVV